jgi:RimJ/RimL family protein N-acetyltransferase
MTDWLTTERLRLRRLTAADLDRLVELDSDPAVMRLLSGGRPTPRSVIEQRVLPRLIGPTTALSTYGAWAAFERTSGTFIGWFSLQRRSATRPPTAELGYRLRRAAWGQGYATEGVCRLLDLAFGELDAAVVIATTYEENLASRRVLEKAGLQLVRRFRLSTADLMAQPTYDASQSDLWPGDDVEYALTRAAWQAQPGRSNSV